MNTINISAPRASSMGSSGRALRTALLSLVTVTLAVTITACSGSGGDGGQNNGIDNSPGNAGGGIVNPSQPGGLTYTYPLNGQDDVYTQTQIALAFTGSVNATDSLALVANPGTGNEEIVATDVTQDSNQSGIFRLQVAGNSGSGERPALQPNTTYAVQATGSVGGGNTQFNAGDTLFSFTTRPLDGRPSANGQFTVARENKIGTQTVPFTQFNPIRARFSESVDDGTVKLCTGSQSVGDANCTVSVTGPNGNVPGKLTALGRYFTFDPTDDLTAGQTYTVAFGSDLKSAFGRSLSGGGFGVTPVSIGNDVEQNLAIQPANPGGDNALNGQDANVANIVSQLIGVNNQAASASADRGGLITRLAEPSNSSRYINTFPALISAGQQFDLEGISLKLNGEVQTPVVTGNIKATFVNDADVYIAANSLTNLETPAAVLLRFDLGISTDIGNNDPIKSLSNGVFNQTAMNIVATGLAVPQANGDVTLTTLGSFPASVNRTGNAITDFELELTLKAANQEQVAGDQIPPTIIAQYPSACFYTFNTTAFKNGGAISGQPGSTTLSDVEPNCIDVLDSRDLNADNNTTIDDNPNATMNDIIFQQPYSSGLPLNASPSVTFSEPVDPTTLAGNITLTNVATSTAVPVRLHSEGSSVVIDPVDPLTADTQYTVNVSNGVTDLAGNGLTGNFPGSTIVSDITFNTEPMIVPDTDDGSTYTGAVRQTSPFLTVLSPGLPCALQTVAELNASKADSAAAVSSGDYFRNGGNLAGRCVGDAPRDKLTYVNTIPPNPFTGDPGGTEIVKILDATPQTNYPVFKQPANVPISAHFSKRVQTDSIIYANGCLINGSGSTATKGDIAVQIMDSSGNCTGVVKGNIAALTPNQPLTRGFSFEPTNAFKSGQRYWIVMCGNANDGSSYSEDRSFGPSECVTSDRIVDRGGRPLNTTPLASTGTQATGSNAPASMCAQDVPRASDPEADTNPLSGIANCYDQDSSGGADLVMPFDGAPATSDFYATTVALPQADTNGNGFFDNDPPQQIPFGTSPADVPDTVIAGTNTGEDRARDVYFNDAQGRERAQLANSVYVYATGRPFPQTGFPAKSGFLSGGQEVAIGTLEEGQDCSATTEVMLQNGTPDDPSDDTPVIGTEVPSSCVPVSLLPGSYKIITNIDAGSGVTPTGRLLLRFPYGRNDDGSSTGKPQQGYIVPECRGTLKTPANLDSATPYATLKSEPYDYAPCFVANLTVTVNGPDNVNAYNKNFLTPQQEINVQAFGPAAFEQNGRLVISTINANRFALTNRLGATGTLKATTLAGAQSLQLVGPAIHGGRSFPVR